MQHDIPASELESFADFIRENFELRDAAWLLSAYQECGLTVCPSPFESRVTAAAIDALQQARPYSAIRIGDGEGNFLAMDTYRDTPVLNESGAMSWLATRADRFLADRKGLLWVKRQILLSIENADAVGVRDLYLWRWNSGVRSVEEHVATIQRDLRGIPGRWRCIDFMLSMARNGDLHGKLICSGHFYFSIAAQLDELLAHSTSIMLVTSRPEMPRLFQHRYPHKRIEYIEVGNRHGRQLDDGAPDFVEEVISCFPDDMKGCLALIGAGVWAEIYCRAVKERGGVALDFGSGFDLLAGRTSRPVHQLVPPETLASYRLQPEID